MRKPRQIDLVPPPAPTADSRIIRRQAKLLDQQRKTLGDVSLEALRLATIQLAVKKLEEGLRLLAQAGIDRQVVNPLSQVREAPAPPKVRNPCAMCGRPGVYQSRNPQIPADKRPWYCEGQHADWARGEDREEQAVRKIAPSLVPTQPAASAPQPPPTEPIKTPGLEAAMASLRGESG